MALTLKRKDKPLSPASSKPDIPGTLTTSGTGLGGLPKPAKKGGIPWLTQRTAPDTIDTVPGALGTHATSITPADLSGGAVILEITPFNLGMFQGEELDAMHSRFQHFFRAIDVPVRILALSEPYSLQPVVEETHKQAAAAHEPWRKEGLLSQSRFMESLARSKKLHSVRYFVTAWPGSKLPANTLAGVAAGAFRTPVSIVPNMSPFFRVPYTEELDLSGLKPQGWHNYLAPTQKGEPYMCVLTSWQVLGEWQLWTMHQLLRLPFPVGLAIDVTTYSPEKAATVLLQSHNSLQGHLNSNGPKDAKAEAAFYDLEEVSQKIVAGQRLHQALVSVLVKGDTKAELMENVQAAERVLLGHLSLRVEYGNQLKALKLFTPTPLADIGIKGAMRTLISEGVAVMMPFGFRSRTDMRGIPWGIDLDGDYPVSYAGWERPDRSQKAGPKAYHHLILGETDSGKTFSTSLLLHREALTGTQVIVLEPMGHGRRLMEIMGKGGSYNPVDFERTSVNLLDIVEPTLDKQIMHVSRCLQVLLSSGSGAGSAAASIGSGSGGAGSGQGNAGAGGAGNSGDRRFFDNVELALVTSALEETYRGIDPATITPRATPRLEKLCMRLSHKGVRGKMLAEEISGMYVDGVYGKIFNPRGGTSLDLRLTSPGVAYDFFNVDPTFRALMYYVVTAAVKRRIRGIRDGSRTQRLILFIDEFRHMIQEPLLGWEVAMLVKTSRTLEAAVWLAEQNLFTFTNTEQGKYIAENTPIVTMFRQKATAVKLARDTYPINEGHAMLLAGAEQGECITMFGNELFHLQMVPSDRERDVFSGS